MIQRILVPLDGSQRAEEAFTFALDLADKYDASLRVLNVISTPLSLMYDPELRLGPVPTEVADRYLRHSEALSKKILAAAQKKAKQMKPNVAISTKAVKGRPPDQILEIAKEENIDLIVMGSRGIGGIKQFLLGSVSNQVSHDAKCPVLLVK